jgi:hypothetical protein
MGLEDGDILYLPSTPIPSSCIMKKHLHQRNIDNNPLVILGKRRESCEEIVTVRYLTTFVAKYSKHIKRPSTTIPL